MAVFEHANWVVKTAVGLCTNLNRHGVPSIPTIPMIVFHSSAKTVSGSWKKMKRRCCFHLRRRLNVAFRNIGAAWLFGVRVSG